MKSRNLGKMTPAFCMSYDRFAVATRGQWPAHQTFSSSKAPVTIRKLKDVMYVLMYVPIYFVENDLSYVLYNEPKRMEYIERFPLTFPTAIFLFGS